MSRLAAATGTGERAAAPAVVGWGVVVGAASAGLPVVLPWLAPVTVYAVEVAVIAAVYIGFAVADGRPRVIAVVLSGSRDDGSAGAATVVARGGVVLAQSPDDALSPSMPRAAIALAGPPADHIVPAAHLGKLLAHLTTVPVTDPVLPAADPLLDEEIALSDATVVPVDRLTRNVPGYGCPTCGGSLTEVGDLAALRFRCRVGHAWSPESLLDEQAVATEGALWMALRALEEKSALGRRMADATPGHGGVRFAEAAADADRAGLLLRTLLDQLARSTATQAE